jgi:hypothetical protein
MRQHNRCFHLVAMLAPGTRTSRELHVARGSQGRCRQPSWMLTAVSLLRDGRGLIHRNVSMSRHKAGFCDPAEVGATIVRDTWMKKNAGYDIVHK